MIPTPTAPVNLADLHLPLALRTALTFAVIIRCVDAVSGETDRDCHRAAVGWCR